MNKKDKYNPKSYLNFFTSKQNKLQYVNSYEYKESMLHHYKNIRDVVEENEENKEISKETGGRYFRAKDQDMLTEIYAQIDSMERTEIEVKSYTKYKELFGWFLIPALIIGMGTETLSRTVFKKLT